MKKMRNYQEAFIENQDLIKFIENRKIIYGAILILISLLIANLHVATWPFFFVLFVPYLVEYFISLDIINFDLILKIKIFILKRTNKDSEKLVKLHADLEDNKKKRGVFCCLNFSKIHPVVYS